jgi:curli production assembly/transport component CsgG
MKKVLLSLLLLLTLSGCAHIHMENSREEPVALQPRESLTTKIPELDGPAITIAVYGFQDKTGQMKPNDKLAVFSKAVTQGAEVFLIKSLQDSKNWFKVVERVGLDNLIKERQLIRNQREVYEGKDARPLKPMTVAGVMIEGGIIGYDSNIRSGGNGARFLGIGGSQQYRVDEIVISMRLISVNSGEVLLTSAVSKTIYSTQHNVGVLRFVDAGTKALELENGMALNEPTTYAVRVAIEQAVHDMIIEGEKKGIWRFKKPKPVVEQSTPTVNAVPEKPEEKKDELVQPQTSQAPQGAPEPVPAAPIEPVGGKSNEAIPGVEPKKEEKVTRIVPIKPEHLVVIDEKTEAKAETKTIIPSQELKSNAELFAPRYLAQDAFVYKEANEKSQRTWLLKKGTELTIISPGPEGWHLVRDAEKRKGFVKQDVLTNKQQ